MTSEPRELKLTPDLLEYAKAVALKVAPKHCRRRLSRSTAAPEELAVIGPVGRTAQQPGQTLNRRAVGNGHGQHQAPEVMKRPVRKLPHDALEKSLSFPWHPADGNHAATPSISLCWHKSYRQDEPFFFCASPHRVIPNRSV